MLPTTLATPCTVCATPTLPVWCERCHEPTCPSCGSPAGPLGVHLCLNCQYALAIGHLTDAIDRGDVPVSRWVERRLLSIRSQIRGALGVPDEGRDRGVIT